MNEHVAIDLLRQALTTALWLSLPILVVVFLFGIVMSLLQTLFSIQDAAFSTVPRLAVLVITFLLVLPWMTGRLISYTVHLVSNLSGYAH
jgi:flagellar biosynthetic protein FliQ